MNYTMDDLKLVRIMLSNNCENVDDFINQGVYEVTIGYIVRSECIYGITTCDNLHYFDAIYNAKDYTYVTSGTYCCNIALSDNAETAMIGLCSEYLIENMDAIENDKTCPCPEFFIEREYE